MANKFSLARVTGVKIQYLRLDDNSGKFYERRFTSLRRFNEWLNKPENDVCLVRQILLRYNYDKYSMEK